MQGTIVCVAVGNESNYEKYAKQFITSIILDFYT